MDRWHACTKKMFCLDRAATSKKQLTIKNGPITTRTLITATAAPDESGRQGGDDDDNNSTTEEVSIETQNTYDDEAIQKFLKDNYFDSRGNIVAFSSTSTTDDNEKPLSDYNPVKLNSGVIYISRYTPTNGKAIVATDKIKLMHNTYSL